MTSISAATEGKESVYHCYSGVHRDHGITGYGRCAILGSVTSFREYGSHLLSLIVHPKYLRLFSSSKLGGLSPSISITS